nr:hypothetical protein [Actinomycetota bacterium]
VYYVHFESEDLATQNLDKFNTSMDSAGEESGSGDWEGGGMQGKWAAYSVDNTEGAGALIFTVEGTPLLGTILYFDTSGGEVDLEGYFKNHIQPGSGG